MPRNRLLVAAGIAAAAALALTGCANGVTPAADAKPVKDGTIVYAHQQEPACVFGGWIEQAYLSYQVLDSLTSLDDDGAAVPWLADDWVASDDGLTWTFTLKDGVSFTDGTPLTAASVAYNFDYWLAGGNSTAQVWLDGYYSSAEATDDHTLVLHLDKPYPRLPETLAQGYFGIQSQHALETRSDEQNCEQPIGSGAFTVQSWNRGESIELVRNEDYTSWPANAKHTGPARVEKVDWRFVPDGTTRSAALKSDEVDAIYDVPSIEWQSLDAAGFELHKYVTPGRPQQLAFNTAEGPFADENVRKAFAYSLDRKTLVDTVGQGVIPFEGNGAVSQATPGYSEKAADAYSFDLAKAKRLLDDAGWSSTDAEGYRVKDGKRLEVVLPYGAGSIINAEGASILQGVAEQAKAAGFAVKLVPVPQSEFFAGAYSKPDERDIYAGYWTSVTAGILWINWRSTTTEKPNGNNSAFYNSAELEKLILDANSTADLDAQNALYAKAQEYIADHALSIGLYDRLSTLAVSPLLKDVWQENSQGGPVFHDAYFVG
ncbi:peptide/nickel transport system substrate-binding protein [Paramicrobacterium humi]|uniref:Peptide/nickel transport system substrate-binding protein n=1 Tax=Paramicrobacterium humi TaxID=640635 RepID=A0A1H4LGK7_9MICO|nr:ABC transporter substrate-binding protein [Microbacterium humi]SEB69830.1 peptide/nickel transport system substrate-binding protein [Microbacterium humi]